MAGLVVVESALKLFRHLCGFCPRITFQVLLHVVVDPDWNKSHTVLPSAIRFLVCPHYFLARKLSQAFVISQRPSFGQITAVARPFLNSMECSSDSES